MGALALAGCAVLGAETAFPGPVQTSGVGPMRRAFAEETGLADEPEGHVLNVAGPIGPSHVSASGDLYYVSADALADPPARDPALGPAEIDWARFGPRRIFRSVGGEDLGFAPGEVALEASAPWEGQSVFDPWALEVDGQLRLYYAAEGGIGLAEGELGRTLTKRPDPLLPDARAPSVVADPDGGWLLYFESSAGIGLASSTDGRSFRIESEALGLRQEASGEQPAELRLSAPGALVTRTPAGRSVVRIYFGVEREDGSRVLAMAASLDGRRFERAPEPVYVEEEASPAGPRPHLRDDGVTLLYATVATNAREERRTLIAGVIPASARLASP